MVRRVSERKASRSSLVVASRKPRQRSSSRNGLLMSVCIGCLAKVRGRDFAARAASGGWDSKTRVALIPQLQRSLFRPVHCSFGQPFERGAEQKQVILLPHGVVRRARKIHKNLLAG